MTVLATSDVYAAGSQSGSLVGTGGTPSPYLFVTGLSSLSFNTTGSITLNSGGNYNDPDGVGAAVSTSSNSGYGSISGITEPGAGALLGVFLATGGPTGAAPASLNYTTTSSISSLSYSPLLDQVFFIGDGMTGDGTGSAQTFVVPTGATFLYLGISDAGGYNGSPSSYGDNSGMFTVNATGVSAGGGGTISATPEPSSVALLGTGVLGVLGAARRRFRS